MFIIVFMVSIEFLKDEIAYAVLQENISKLYYENVPDVVIIEELKEFNSISKRIKNFAACYLPTTTQLILAMKKFDQDWVDRTFARIELKLQQSVTLKSMVIGKLGRIYWLKGKCQKTISFLMNGLIRQIYIYARARIFKYFVKKII